MTPEARKIALFDCLSLSGTNWAAEGGQPRDRTTAKIFNRFTTQEALSFHAQGSGPSDSVAAYDALAHHYSAIVAARRPYLDAVERIIIARAMGAGSLLDIGAGDGVRTFKIVRSTGIPRVAIVEPSVGMRARLRNNALVWGCPISEMPDTDLRFDVITCLWNVLGHIPTTPERVSALAKARSLLSPGGLLFVDVNHRYNASTYGWARTLCRIAYDHMSWSDTNGDVSVCWNMPSQSVRTRGHLFVGREIEGLCRAAGLTITNRWVVSYENGSRKKIPLLGNLLYQLSHGQSRLPSTCRPFPKDRRRPRLNGPIHQPEY